MLQMSGSSVSSLVLALGLVFSAAADAASDRFARILDRGVIAVGVKADTPPWGFRNSDGQLVGMEIDMARDVADALGVDLELVAVQSSNRMQFLEQGRIDLMIATMSDKSDRRRVVGGIDPNYYTSGTNLMARKGAVSRWEDLNGKPVCGRQGAFYNRIVSQRYGANIVAFVGNAEAKQALRDGKCVAWVFDDSVIAADLASGQWDDYEMPVMTEDDTPWVLAVPLEERDGIFGTFMSGMVYRWHASGRLAELEAKWGIRPTEYLARMHEKFRFEHDHLE